MVVIKKEQCLTAEFYGNGKHTAHPIKKPFFRRTEEDPSDFCPTIKIYMPAMEIVLLQQRCFQSQGLTHVLSEVYF